MHPVLRTQCTLLQTKVLFPLSEMVQPTRAHTCLAHHDVALRMRRTLGNYTRTSEWTFSLSCKDNKDDLQCCHLSECRVTVGECLLRVSTPSPRGVFELRRLETPTHSSRPHISSRNVSNYLKQTVSMSPEPSIMRIILSLPPPLGPESLL